MGYLPDMTGFRRPKHDPEAHFVQKPNCGAPECKGFKMQVHHYAKDFLSKLKTPDGQKELLSYQMAIWSNPVIQTAVGLPVFRESVRKSARAMAFLRTEQGLRVAKFMRLDGLVAPGQSVPGEPGTKPSE